MFKFILLCLTFLSSPLALAEEPTKGPLHSIEISEFVQLPNDFQVFYVAGAIDGMTFVTYGYKIKDHDKLVECYRSMPLGEFTNHVVELAKSSTDNKVNVATLVAKTAGKYCKSKT